jgi:hypothetical protein
MDPDGARYENQIPLRIDPELVDALEPQLDSLRIASGADFEIVFEMFLVTSKYQIDAGIDAAPADAAVEVVRRPDLATQDIVSFPRHMVESFE